MWSIKNKNNKNLVGKESGEHLIYNLKLKSVKGFIWNFQVFVPGKTLNICSTDNKVLMF